MEAVGGILFFLDAMAFRVFRRFPEAVALALTVAARLGFWGVAFVGLLLLAVATPGLFPFVLAASSVAVAGMLPLASAFAFCVAP
jgi:hypothetical protein